MFKLAEIKWNYFARLVGVMGFTLGCLITYPAYCFTHKFKIILGSYCTSILLFTTKCYFFLLTISIVLNLVRFQSILAYLYMALIAYLKLNNFDTLNYDFFLLLSYWTILLLDCIILLRAIMVLISYKYLTNSHKLNSCYLNNHFRHYYYCYKIL